MVKYILRDISKYHFIRRVFMRKEVICFDLNILDKLLSKILKRYTYKIYRKGIVDGYNWANCKRKD